jgi:hypothetical protein
MLAMNFIDSFLRILVPLQVLRSDGFPERESSSAILVSHLHVGYCEFDDNIKIVGCDWVAMFAKLVHDLIGSFSLQIVVESRNDVLEGKIAVLFGLEDMSQEVYAVSDCS